MGCASSQSAVIVHSSEERGGIVEQKLFSNTRLAKDNMESAAASDANDHAIERSISKDSTTALKKRIKIDFGELALKDVLSEIEVRMKRLHSATDYTGQSVGDDLNYIYSTGFLSNGVVRYSKEDRRKQYAECLVKMDIGSLFRKVWTQLFPLINQPYSDVQDICFHMRYILVAIWNHTDHSNVASKHCSSIELYKDLFTYLNDQLFSNLPSDDKRIYLVKGCFGILTNIIQMFDVRQEYRDSNAVSIMQLYQNSENLMTKCKAAILLAYLMNEEENALINADDDNIIFLIKILKNAMEKTDHWSKRYGYKAYEVINALNLLSANDSNKAKIVDNGALPYYVQLMQTDGSASSIEQVKASNGIWSFSFTCKDILAGEPGLIQALENLAQQEENFEAKKQAQGALWIILGKAENLRSPSTPKRKSIINDLDKRDKEIVEEDDADEEEKDAEDDKRDGMPHVMISYQWGVQQTMIKVRDRLKQAGFKVWMDVDEMSGSILEAMAMAVENAAVILVCMTQKYKESPNCRTEAEYAFRLRKDVVPLRLQTKYLADGWLGAMIGNKLYFDLSLPEKFETNFENLIRELGERGRIKKRGLVEMPITPQVVSIVKAENTPKENDNKSSMNVSLWSEKDVHKWLLNIGLEKETKSGFDGTLLLEMRSMLQEAPEFFYSSLRDNMKFPLIHILKFTKALKQLR